MMSQQKAGGHGEADGAPVDEELVVEPLEHRLVPRDAPRRHDRHRGARVNHEHSGGTRQCRADLGEPRGCLLAVHQREHECAQADRGHHPAGVEGRPRQRAAAHGLRDDHGGGEHEHGESGRHEQDEHDEEGLVHVDGVGAFGDVTRDGPDQAGRQEDAEDRGERHVRGRRGDG